MNPLLKRHAVIPLILLFLLMGSSILTTNSPAADTRFDSGRAAQIIEEGRFSLEICIKENASSIKTFDPTHITVIRMARAIISLGHFGGSEKSGLDVLRKVAGSKPFAAIRAPGWAVFPDEYLSSLERLGLADESAEQGYFGSGAGRTLSELARAAIARIESRAK